MLLDKIKKTIEALLFMKGEEGLSVEFFSTFMEASLESLAIIAYNQPITKVQIDKIRGVSSDSILHSLISKELIVSTKTLDTIGKPKLYETTEMFLDVFGIESLDELPKSDDISESEISKSLEK